MAAAAVMADEFAKVVNPSVFSSNRARSLSSTFNSVPHAPRKALFYCRKPGHVIANCEKLIKKEQSHPGSLERHAKPVGLITATSDGASTVHDAPALDPCFEPFTFNGLVSLPDCPGETRHVRILRDTGGFPICYSKCSPIFKTVRLR